MSYTPEGKERYNHRNSDGSIKAAPKEVGPQKNKASDMAGGFIMRKLLAKKIEEANKRLMETYTKEKQTNVENNKTNIKKKISGDHSPEKDMETINPKYEEALRSGDMKYCMNCTMCTTAYELRRRGYDVKANTSITGRDSSDVRSWFDIPEDQVSKTSNYKELQGLFDKVPDGSRGNIMAGVTKRDFKHSMIWEKNDGKVIIRDAQTNKVYDSLDNSILNKKSKRGYEFVRTDNAKINWDNIRDAVVEN